MLHSVLLQMYFISSYILINGPLKWKSFSQKLERKVEERERRKDRNFLRLVSSYKPDKIPHEILLLKIFTIFGTRKTELYKMNFLTMVRCSRVNRSWLLKLHYKAKTHYKKLVINNGNSKKVGRYSKITTKIKVVRYNPSLLNST